MTPATALRTARSRARLSLRDLAERAGTSHSTLAAYEAGRKVPSVETFERILRAVNADRGAELLEVLRLAERFPARHDPDLRFPRFPS